MTYKLPTPSEYDKELCMLFAKSCVYTNKDEYGRRNQDNTNKIVSDIYNGKLAEIMVHELFRKKDQKPFPVDFLIYDRFDKSFDADITTKKHKVHVKSCLGDSPFPNSWLFQPNDGLVTKPQKDEILALVVLNKDKSGYCYIIPAAHAVYGDPVKKSLNKKVIYEESLLNS